MASAVRPTGHQPTISMSWSDTKPLVDRGTRRRSCSLFNSPDQLCHGMRHHAPPCVGGVTAVGAFSPAYDDLVASALSGLNLTDDALIPFLLRQRCMFVSVGAHASPICTSAEGAASSSSSVMLMSYWSKSDAGLVHVAMRSSAHLVRRSVLGRSKYSLIFAVCLNNNPCK
jgi:hypothetical protein